jgi:predicted ribosome quality control (RQC) complex YloA/Tae2 family protein
MASKGRPYRTVLFDGWEILVGRSSEDNDYLTFDVAAPGDTWLHAGGGIAGSHVVVRNPDGAVVPRPVLERAAGLAAGYSKARGAPRVEVHYCHRRDVSKPRGAPAGLVELRSWKALKVAPVRLADEPG